MQKSGFFTSVGGDRKYGADWLAQFTASIISNGVYTTELTVSGNGMSVSVGPGRAWINGYMYLNDTAMTLPLSAADGALSRTDLVVLRLDMTNRQITLAVVQGDFGGGVPALTRTSDVYELCLARIAVAAGTTQVTAQIITDTRADETVCGIVAGAVTQLSTGELLEQLKAGFDEWFNNVKGQLSTDAAGNLQNQIDDVVGGMSNLDKVGDIKITPKTDLGDKWLLCNGDIIDHDTYPELYEKLVLAIDNHWDFNKQVINPNGGTIIDLVKGNGYYVALLTLGGTSTNYIAWSTDYALSWTIYQAIFTTEIAAKTITFIDNKFVVVGVNTNNGYPYLEYTENPNIQAGWVEKLVISNSLYPASRVKFVNGLYFICGKDSSTYARYAYCSTMLGSWSYSSQSPGVSSGMNLTDVVFFLNNYVFCGSNGNYAAYFYGSTLNSAFTVKTMSTGGSGANFNRMLIADSCCIFAGTTGGSSAYPPLIAYTSDLVNFKSMSLSNSGNGLTDVIQVNDLIVVLGTGGFISFIRDIRSDVWVNAIYNISVTGSSYIAYDEEKQELVLLSFITNGFKVWSTGKRLPMVSIPGSYAYIKAKN